MKYFLLLFSSVICYSQTLTIQNAFYPQRANPFVFTNPESVFGLRNWYDTSDNQLYKDTAGTDPATADGDRIVLWKDKRPILNHLTNNATPASVDIFLKTAKNNTTNSGIDFVGLDALQSSNFTAFYTGTIFAVVWPRLTNLTGQTIISGFENGNDQNEFGMIILNDGQFNGYSDYGATANFLKTSPIDTNAPNIVTLQLEGGVSSLMRRNGSNEVTGAGGTGFIEQYRVGGYRSAGLPYYLQGWQFEILVYSNKVSSQNITNIERWLGAKYSIPLIF